MKPNQVDQQQIPQWNQSSIRRLGPGISQRNPLKPKKNMAHVMLARKGVTMRNMIITNMDHTDMIALDPVMTMEKLVEIIIMIDNIMMTGRIVIPDHTDLTHNNLLIHQVADQVEATEVITLLVEIPAEIIDISQKMEITGEITEMTEITGTKRNLELTTAQGQNTNIKKLEMTRKNKRRKHKNRKDKVRTMTRDNKRSRK